MEVCTTGGSMYGKYDNCSDVCLILLRYIIIKFYILILSECKELLVVYMLYTWDYYVIW